MEGERIVPHYLGARDEPWLRALLDEYARFVGRRVSELRERLREPLPVSAPKAKLRMAVHVLMQQGQGKTQASVPPRDARWLVFRGAASERDGREVVLSNIAQSLGIAAIELEAALFADLPSEQRVRALPADLAPSSLALLVNHAMVASLLRRAARVKIRVWGNTRALVRHARLLGLICVLSRVPQLRNNRHRTLESGAGLDEQKQPESSGVALDISGPFALFRRTEVYGRALASLLPRAAWCHHFEIEATCATGRGPELSTLLVQSGDPIGVGRELKRFDSGLEERFAKDFAKAAPEWDVIREPHPVEAEGTLVFPDFELVHRREPTRRWLLEIVGFWTPEYLSEKLRRLRAAGLERLVLCIDERRCCGESVLPVGARIVRYRARIDPKAVVAVLG